MCQEHQHTITSSTYKTKDKVWLRLGLPFCGGKGGGELGANKESTHLGPLDLVKAACALEVEAIGALDLMEEEASCLLGPLDVVGVSLNILISALVRGYLTSLKQTTSSSPEKPSSLDTLITFASIGIYKQLEKTLEVAYKHF
ncbi:hypothetical protein Tco_0008384 [Tanacetum coccineum]